MLNRENMYILTRDELKNKNACDFKHNDVVTCGKYRINISYYDCRSDEKMPVSFFTTVYTRDDLRDLKISKQPQYIRDFIECYNMIRDM